MKRRFILLVLTLGFLSLNFSCKENGSSLKNNTEVKSLTPTFPVSAKTSLFLKDYQSQINTDSSNLSLDFIAKHGIIKQNGAYLVNGFIKTNPDFDLKELESTGIVVADNQEELKSIRIPLKDLETFLNLKGIDYFEISESLALPKNLEP